jgi:hypothetical protein
MLVTRQLVLWLMVIAFLLSSCSELPEGDRTPGPGSNTAETETNEVPDEVADTTGTDDPTTTGSTVPTTTEVETSGDDETRSDPSVGGTPDIPEPGTGLIRPKYPDTTIVVPPPRDQSSR